VLTIVPQRQAPASSSPRGAVRLGIALPDLLMALAPHANGLAGGLSGPRDPKREMLQEPPCRHPGKPLHSGAHRGEWPQWAGASTRIARHLTPA